MGIGLSLLAAVLLLVAGLSRFGRLPRNYLLGLRTRTTLRSEETWRAAHFAVAGELAAGGLGAAVGASVVTAADHRIGLAFGYGALAVVLIVVVHAGVRADSLARSIREHPPNRGI